MNSSPFTPNPKSSSGGSPIGGNASGFGGSAPGFGGIPSASSGPSGSYGGYGNLGKPWNNQTPPPAPPGPQGWHFVLTLATLSLALITSFISATLFGEPPGSMAGEVLRLTLPAAAVLFGAFFVEHSTSAMTPYVSRNLQLIVALVGSLLVALCVLISSFAYQLSFRPRVVIPVATETPTATPTATPAPTPEPVEQFVFIIDKSGSMFIWETDWDQINVDTVTYLLSQMPDNARVGLVNFTEELRCVVDIAPLTEDHRDRLLDAVAENPGGDDNFTLAINAALMMLEGKPELTDVPTRLFMLTDGQSTLTDSDSLLKRMKDVNAHLYCIELNGEVPVVLASLVTGSGGAYIGVDHPDELLKTAEEMIDTTPVPTSTPVPTPEPSPTPEPTPVGPEPFHPLAEAPNLLLIMHVLRGIILGVTLSLMLSVYHQIRIQIILSPVLEVLIWALLATGASSLLAYPALCFVNGLCGLVIMRRNRS